MGLYCLERCVSRDTTIINNIYLSIYPSIYYLSIYYIIKGLEKGASTFAHVRSHGLEILTLIGEKEKNKVHIEIQFRNS